MPHFLTSAKTGERVEDAFFRLAQTGVGGVEAPLDLLGGSSAAKRDPLVSVADRILMDFCREFGGIEAAMPVIKTQASRAGLDVRAPTREALRRFVDHLTEIERGFRPAARVAENHDRRIGWIRETA